VINPGASNCISFRSQVPGILMAILTLQSRGLLFLLLLAGNEVANVSAMRSTIDIATMVQDFTKEDSSVFTGSSKERAKEDSSVPTSSSECLWAKDKGKCEPAQYCYFGRRWSNLGGLNQDKACKLKWLYEPDEKLADRFGTASAKVIMKSEEFRTSGSILQLGKLKDYYLDLGKCANAATSEVPTHKTYLNRLKTAFQDEPISQYAGSVDAMAREIPGLKEFNIDGLEDEARNAKALERTEENMDLGFNKNILTRTFATKINLMELMKVPALADADQATIAAQVKKVAPSLSQVQLDTVVSEAVAKKDAQLQDCSNDDECLKRRTEARMEAMSQHVSEVEHTSVNALLQYAESKGLSQAKHDEDHHERRNRAFSLLEEHVESVEGELTEHGQEMLIPSAFYLFFCLVFIVLAMA